LLDVRLERGLRVDLRFDGEPAFLADQSLFLLEADAWADVTLDPTTHRGHYASGHLTPDEFGRRHVVPDDDGTAHLTGLPAGSFRFKSLSGDVLFDPETVTLPCAQPLIVSCTRRE